MEDTTCCLLFTSSLRHLHLSFCSGQDIAHLVLFAHLIAGRYCGAGRGEAHRRRVWRGTGYGLLMSVMSGVLKLHFVTGPAA